MDVFECRKAKVFAYLERTEAFYISTRYVWRYDEGHGGKEKGERCSEGRGERDVVKGEEREMW